MHEMNVKISAIVTCHNYARYLTACLDSLLCQTYPFHEIILIDDASTDNTFDVALRYSSKVRYEKVSFRSVALAREHGIRLASGEFIVNIDADNRLLPAYNEKLVAPLLANPSAGISYCGFHYDFEDDQSIRPIQDVFPLIPFDAGLLKRRNYIDACSMVRKKAWLSQDSSLAWGFEDWDHWLRMVERGWLAVLVPDRLFHYRIHENAMTQIMHRFDQHHNVYWQVRSRHLDQDLTILTLFSGKKQLLKPYFAAVAALKKPAKTQFLFIDNSNSVDFFHRLHSFNSDTHSYPESARDFDEDGADADNQNRVARHLCGIYTFAKNFIRGKRLLIWEHDVVPAPDAFERLEETAVSKRADFCGASVLSRKTAEPLVWRLYGEKPEYGVYRVPAARSVKRVFATSFSFLVCDAISFLKMRIRSHDEGIPFFGCDLHAGIWARKHNLRWFADGTIRCQHLDTDSNPVTLGGVEFSRAGRLGLIHARKFSL